jgi:hypothetical protein
MTAVPGASPSEDPEALAPGTGRRRFVLCSSVQLRSPEWRLRELCPDCGQGSLLLMACPGCAHVDAQCEEDGARFVDIAKRMPLVDAEKTPCSRCSCHLLRATLDAQRPRRFRRPGLTHGDYC